MPEITLGELVLLIAAIAVFVVGVVASMLRVRSAPRDPTGRRTETLRVIAKTSLYLGTLMTIGVLTWHCTLHGRQPVEDSFGALLCLGILLALFVIYTQRAHPLRGLEFFIMPVVLLLLVAAAVVKPHEYGLTTGWLVVHLVSAFGGFVAFTVAGAAGSMYLFANRRLRQKRLVPGQGFGSLERLEHITMISVTLGFALLTVGLITGFFRVLHPGEGATLAPLWYRNPKIMLTCVAWVVYALVLHSPINPSFRGRRTAMLSVLGFVLMVGIVAVVEFTK